MNYLLIFWVIFLQAFWQGNHKNTETLTQDPKSIQDYWKRIDSLESRGLIQDADKLLDECMPLISADALPFDWVKSRIYKARYLDLGQDQPEFKGIVYLESQLNNARGATLPVLQSLLGAFYMNYSFNAPGTGTETNQNRTDSLEYWTPGQSIRRANELYLLSVSQAEQWQNIPLSALESVVHFEEKNTALFSNLHELLINRALNHFYHSNAMLVEPAYAFYPNDPLFYSPAEIFEKGVWQTADTNALMHKALKLHQQVIPKIKNNIPLLVQWDVLRLAAVNRSSTLENKEQLYHKALQDLLLKWKTQPIYVYLACAFAHLEITLGDEYVAGEEETQHLQWKKKEALQLLTEALKAFPNAPHATETQNLIDRIKAPDFALQTSSNLLPNTDRPMLISYKNTNSVAYHIYSLSPEQWLNLENQRTRQIRQLIGALPLVRKDTFQLKDQGDYQWHTTEVAFKGLKPGLYLIVLDDELKAVDGNANLRYNLVQSTQLSLVQRDGEVWVADKTTSCPVPKAKVSAYERVYRDRGSFNELVREGNTDDNGYYKALPKGDFASLLIRHGDQILISQASSRHWYETNEAQERILLFTDRAVYRPGQTVYFKGILLTYELDVPKKLIQKQRVKLSIYDVNSQEINTLDLTSNEFGSFEGSFVLPATGLTGSFHIRDNAYRGSVYFAVEEYKRPKFEVKLNEPTEVYSLGDRVTLKGQALMFAGTAISGAEVRYNIMRSSYFPWRTGRISYPYRAQKIIAQGSTRTMEDGSFEITFVADPDAAIKSDWAPVYQYSINADVIDLSGETRSGSLNINISKKRFLPTLQVPEKVLLPEKANIRFDLTNLSGKTQDVPVNIKIIALQGNNKLWIPRIWKAPDVRSIDETTWRKLFPNHPYGEEHDPESWPEGKIWLDKTLLPTITKELTLPESLPAGLYRVQMEAKDGNELLKTAALLQVFDKSRKDIPMPTRPVAIFTDKNTYQPGEKALVQVRSVDKKACVYLAIEKKGKIVREGWQEVNGLYNLELPVQTEDRGGFFLHAVFHWQEGAVILNIPIVVPHSDKQLKIHWLSERKQMDPGMQESWQISIKDYKDSAANAELMAVLYDASLDQISPKAWWSGIVHPENQSRILFSQVFNQGLILNSRPAPWTVNLGSTWYSPEFKIHVHQPYYPQYGGVRRSHTKMDMEMYARVEMAASEGPQAPAVPGMDDLSEDTTLKIPAPKKPDQNIVPRRSLNETVFFIPGKRTDKNGLLSIDFKMEEALTRWKFRLYAHDQQLASGYSEYEVETFKELMVFPNVPRFVRQNDRIAMSFKVQNQSETDQQVELSIQLRDALNGDNLNHWLQHKQNSKSVLLAKGKAETWAPIVSIPNDFTGILELTYAAKGENHTDAEVHHLSVLTNRQLVTETLPIWVNANEKRSFSLNNIAAQMKSNTLQAHRLSLEFSPNPAWYALQAMPYIMEQDNQSTDFKVNRLYANTLGATLMEKYPQLRAFFSEWQKEPGVLNSPLFENEALKSALLNETPWVLQAKSEREQKQRLALLFDVNRMAMEQHTSIQQLKTVQNQDGGFPWFPGGRSNWYTTQYVIEKLGHLEHLGAKNVRADKELRQILIDAINYIDTEAIHYIEKSNQERNNKTHKVEAIHLTSMMIHYLYVRSFFGDIPQTMTLKTYSSALFDLLEKNYMNFGLQEQAIGAVALSRNLRKSGAELLVRSMVQRSVYNEEMGRFWKTSAGWYWHQRPIESHTAVMEALQEISPNEKTLTELSRWLLKQKQTNQWPGSSATSRAIFVLLSNNTQWLTESSTPQISINGQALSLSNINQETGSGYFQKELELPTKETVKWDIELINKAGSPGWGGIYWQYFEDLDKIQTYQATPLRLTKNIFVKEQTGSGVQLRPLTDSAGPNVGDLLTVRIEFRVDRAMEFVHLKDMRAAAFEPVDVRSGYVWSNRLFYYQAIRDQSVDFFFETLSPGTYVLEYDLRVFHSGHFSNGISTMQSVYAPEFSAHSAGYRFTIKP